MFYDLDSSRVTLREYSWGAPLVLAPITLPIAAVLKLLRVRVPGSSDDPNVDSLASYQVDPAEIPDEASEKMRPLEEQLARCGFTDPVYFAMFDPSNMTAIYQAVYRHPARTTIAKVHYRIWFRTKPIRRYLFPMFISSFADGTFLVSSAGKADLLAPRCCTVNRLVGAAVEQLWKSHSEQLILQAFGKTANMAYSQHDAMDLAERHHAAVRDYHLDRGVFVMRSAIPAAPDEPAAPQSAPVACSPEEPVLVGNSSGKVEVAPPGSLGIEPEIPADAMETATLDEIQRQQDSKTGWGNVILMLVLSAALFFMVGIPGEKWQTLLLIVAVLLVHEMGHLAAMWLFGYRNLRMLFIPLFGAVALGKNYNVPGWKKAIVSLMGPLPGIVIGVCLGIAAMLHGNKALYQPSFMFLAINGFNLLPVLPLDGGWIMHTVLFSRHPVMDVLFRAVAALGLLAMGLGGSPLWYVGLAMLLGLPVAYRVARVARVLRLRGLDATSADSQTIPLPVARTIVGEIRRAFPARTDAKASARMSLSVFESLNTRPPGIAASFGFVCLHGGAFLTALVFGFILIFAQHMNLGGLMMARAMGQPKHAVDSGPLLALDGHDAERAAESDLNTIVADFEQREKAEAAYRDIVVRLPSNASARLLGQTLLVALPVADDAARETWFNDIRRLTAAIRVDNQESHAMFSLTAVPPDAETSELLVEEASLYLAAPSDMYLIPPWSPEDKITPAQLRVRRTFAAVSKLSTRNFEDARWQSLVKKGAEARRRGDQRAASKLEGERRELSQRILSEGLNGLRSEGAEKWDLAMIDLYEKRPTSDVVDAVAEFRVPEEEASPERDARMKQWQRDDAQWCLACGKLMGQLPLSSDKPSGRTSRFSATGGNAASSGLMVHFGWVSFARPTDGVPALVDWLRRKNCTALKYQFYLDSDGDIEED